jgi:formylglycine-generating enzyme
MNFERMNRKPLLAAAVAVGLGALALSTSGCDGCGFSVENSCLTEGTCPSDGQAPADGATDDSLAPDAASEAGADSGSDAVSSAEAASDATVDAPTEVGVAEASDSADVGQCPDATSNACAQGSTRCAGGGLESCTLQSNGCLGWSIPTACPLGQQCSVQGGVAGCSPPSCSIGGPGLTDCGPGGQGTESCCTTLAVSGGTFFRSYDGTSSGYTSQAYPATVSTFALDKYEITVGRFRQFVDSVALTGWQPPAGAGKHTHLNRGLGMAYAGSPGSYEGGWDVTWNSNLPANQASWSTHLSCGGTWTDTPGPYERLPISCIDWYDAYAFCIWDGGFLPSETEWNYAAAGGGGDDGQRVFPWSSPSNATTIDCTYANYDPSGMGTLPGSPCVGVGAPNAVGTEVPKGAGKWGHADLAGNVVEWTTDWYEPYVTPCDDCAYLTYNSSYVYRVIRGGNFEYSASPYLLVSTRYSGYGPAAQFGTIGARCARTP